MSLVNKPIMLITGSTKGLGKAIKAKFQSDYEIIGIARSGADLNGDLTDPQFRKKILQEVNPNIVINNAGVSGKHDNTTYNYMLNLVAVIDLTKEFGKKMDSGHIINISSLSAGFGLIKSQFTGELDYIISKKALSDFSQLYQFNNCKKLKVCSLEPGFIMTDFFDIKSRFEQMNEDDFLNKQKITPMKPEYIASVVDWILKQPADISISSIRIMNHYGA